VFAFVASPAIPSTAVYLYDGHEVLSEFILWGTILLIENDDFAGVLRANPFDELETKPCEPVSGSHNN
jgi:hypothetical protein